MFSTRKHHEMAHIFHGAILTVSIPIYRSVWCVLSILDDEKRKSILSESRAGSQSLYDIAILVATMG